MDMNAYFLGARLFYWLYLALTLLFAGGVIVYWLREWIRKVFYSIKNPESLIKIAMFYPGNYMRNFYRLIPLDGSFGIMGGSYNYTDTAVYKNKDFYAFTDPKGKTLFEIDGKEYEIKKDMLYRKRFDRWPSIHYIYGNPFPINFEDKKGEPEIKFNASDWDRLKKSTILTKIYASISSDNLIKFVLVVVVIILLMVGVGFFQQMGWIDFSKNITRVVKP